MASHSVLLSLPWFTLVTAFSALSLSSLILYRLFFHPLKDIPGPQLAKVTELWRTNEYWKGTWHNKILQLHEQHGSVVRIAPNEVSFVDKDGLVSVYGHSKAGVKTNWYNVWTPPGSPTGVFNATNTHEHSFLRRRIATVYSMTSILAMEEQIQSVADSLWKRFNAFAASEEAFDLQKWTNFFAFDVVGKLALGGSLGYIEAGEDHNGLIAAIHDMFFAAANTGYLPGQAFPYFMYQGLAALVTKPAGMIAFRGWLDARIAERRARGPPKADGAGDKSKGDMLDHFIAMKDPAGKLVQDSAVRGEGGNIIGAGADTTAIGIASVMGQLMKHKESYARVQAEIDEAAAEGQLTYEVVSRLPYLQACIKEALRLHPSILWQLPRHLPPQGVTIDGHYIPASATVSTSPLSQNRCKEVYGEDANDYNPSRWLVSEGADEERVKLMTKMDMTFGYGSRTCIGKNLALVEITKFVSQLLSQFDMELVDQQKGWEYFSMWFSYARGMHVRIHRRQK